MLCGVVDKLVIIQEESLEGLLVSQSVVCAQRADVSSSYTLSQEIVIAP